MGDHRPKAVTRPGLPDIEYDPPTDPSIPVDAGYLKRKFEERDQAKAADAASKKRKSRPWDISKVIGAVVGIVSAVGGGWKAWHAADKATSTDERLPRLEAKVEEIDHRQTHDTTAIRDDIRELYRSGRERKRSERLENPPDGGR